MPAPLTLLRDSPSVQISLTLTAVICLVVHDTPQFTQLQSSALREHSSILTVHCGVFLTAGLTQSAVGYSKQGLCS